MAVLAFTPRLSAHPPPARTCVEEPPREHAAVLRRQREDDVLRLAALRLVHRHGVGELQLAQLHARVGALPGGGAALRLPRRPSGATTASAIAIAAAGGLVDQVGEVDGELAQLRVAGHHLWADRRHMKVSR